MASPKKRSLFADYAPLPGTYDEMFEGTEPRNELSQVVQLMDRIGKRALKTRQRLASQALLSGGITFTVYSDQEGVERIFPFDVMPRVVSAREWERAESGLLQRITALNMFLEDIYGPQEIVRANKIPEEVIASSSGFEERMRGVRPKDGVYVHVAGIDLIRDADGELIVLEDNLRTPSGVSYVLENRTVMKRALGHVMSQLKVRTIHEYPKRLRDALAELAPDGVDEPRTVVLTPGSFNSAYFEHTFLARRMGCDLVAPSDLFVHDDRVFVKTTAGPERVDVIYRRIDDDFIDPDVFRSDSLLGVPGIVKVYENGGVTLANAIGNGVADDKAVYPFVPDMIRFYLSEEPILGQVETYLCGREKEKKHVLASLSSMVVKQVDASGGYGMLMGPSASADELEAYAARIESNPRNFIAQPLVEFSACPTWTEDGMAPRRVDLRPFIVTGKKPWVLPGGLTRVALDQSSYVVNSSQGGGSKDTWVLEA